MMAENDGSDNSNIWRALVWRKKKQSMSCKTGYTLTIKDGLKREYYGKM